MTAWSPTPTCGSSAATTGPCGSRSRRSRATATPTSSTAPAAAAEAAMPATDAHFTGLLEELTARSLAEQVRTAQRYRDLLQQVANGDLDVTALRAEHDRLVADHQAQLMRDITELGVRYYESILDLNRSYVDRLFDQLYAAAGRAQDPGSPPAAQPSAVELRLAGRPGDPVEAGL